ncbi:hypothetical protein Pla123a_37960 [Posidoniimonas polymericola]|uniref:Cytochrome c domain-containing protein n=1 Tax=Posidoniimonas polymericola TaxID=2528002 RepID=A0A5C5YG39_9BACT|nr:hypothetical protein [Posidoniimonas polymericola]TWT73461.1 hypothetical protein Pla123a_37960 [Posidoniimonas polymericola]
MTRLSCALIAAALLFGASARPAAAIKQFQDEWMKLYVEDNSNEDFVKAAEEAKCFICHQGKKKSNHNPYGEHLEELLSKKDKKDVEKIVKSIKAVAELKSDGDGSPTYAELIAEGKLPGGTLEEAKEEPKKD